MFRLKYAPIANVLIRIWFFVANKSFLYELGLAVGLYNSAGTPLVIEIYVKGCVNGTFAGRKSRDKSSKG